MVCASEELLSAIRKRKVTVRMVKICFPLMVSLLSNGLANSYSSQFTSFLIVSISSSNPSYSLKSARKCQFFSLYQELGRRTENRTQNLLHQQITKKINFSSLSSVSLPYQQLVQHFDCSHLPQFRQPTPGWPAPLPR